MNNDLDIHFKHSDSDAVGTAFALWIADSLLHWLGLFLQGWVVGHLREKWQKHHDSSAPIRGCGCYKRHAVRSCRWVMEHQGLLSLRRKESKPRVSRRHAFPKHRSPQFAE